jgi:hypothetical protein
MKKTNFPGLVISPKYATIAELGLEQNSLASMETDKYLLSRGFQSFSRSMRSQSPKSSSLSSRPFEGRKLRSPKIGMKLTNEIISKFIA